MFSTLFCHGLSRSNWILADAMEHANGFPKRMRPVKSTTWDQKFQQQWVPMLLLNATHKGLKLRSKVNTSSCKHAKICKPKRLQKQDVPHSWLHTLWMDVVQLSYKFVIVFDSWWIFRHFPTLSLFLPMLCTC